MHRLAPIDFLAMESPVLSRTLWCTYHMKTNESTCQTHTDPDLSPDHIYRSISHCHLTLESTNQTISPNSTKTIKPYPPPIKLTAHLEMLPISKVQAPKGALNPTAKAPGTRILEPNLYDHQPVHVQMEGRLALEQRDVLASLG